MANNEFPEDWRDQPCFLVSVPRPLVPYVSGLLKIAEQRGFWATPDDYRRGYIAVTELERCLMATCLDVLLEKQDSLYRMVDTALYGTVYTVEDTDPLVVTPDIQPVHASEFNPEFGVMAQLDRMTQLIDNTVNGTETPLYAYTPSVKEQLQAIIDAHAAEDTDLGDLLTELELIVGLLA